jgi:hypothetical protein
MEQLVQTRKIITKLDTKFEVIKFQLVMYKFFKGVTLSDNEISTLAFILDRGYYKGIYLDVVKNGWFKTEQSARNCIIRAVKSGILLEREEKYKINPTNGY